MQIFVKLFVLWVAVWVANELNFAQNVIFRTPRDSVPKLTKPLCIISIMDASNPPPPPGSKPGRYSYTEDSAAAVWIEDPWWKRVPWFKVLGLAAAFLAVFVAWLRTA